MNNQPDYKTIAKDARIKVLEMIHKAGTSHIGSNFSVIDMAAVLYEKADLSHDRIIWSKGWAAATTYYFLAKKGVIPAKDLDTYCQPESPYIGLTEPSVKGVDFAGGSMGMGLAGGIGFALAKRISKETGTIYVIMSDGEQAIGTTWEGMLIASHHHLANLVVLVDMNNFQAMDTVEHVLNIEPLGDKWKACGWHVQRINGHDFTAIENTLDNLSKDKPNVILCDTIKGKGVALFEDKLIWHYKNVDDQTYKEALNELNH